MSPTGGKDNISKRQDRSNVENKVDGPQPMRNLKPSKLNPNSADQFSQLHRAQYEIRGKRSTDHVDRVNRHNAAHPVLRDELDRRQSTRKVTAVNARKNNRGRVVLCNVCSKQNNGRIDKRKIKPRCQRRNRKRPNQSRVKERNLVRCRRTKNRVRNCNCQRIPAIVKKLKNKHSSIKIINLDSLDTIDPDLNSVEADSIDKYFNNPQKRTSSRRNISLVENESVAGSDVGSLIYPSTTRTDRSSYQSCLSSMEGEPMD